MANTEDKPRRNLISNTYPGELGSVMHWKDQILDGIDDRDWKHMGDLS